MNENISTFFTSENRNQIQIGDYYYADNTLSHEYQNEKECIGIVFSIRSNNFEYSNGSVVSLKDAKDQYNNFLHLWCNVEDNNDEDFIRNINKSLESDSDQLKSDHGGWFYSKNYTVEYIAIDAARKHLVELSERKTTGWYMPSSGQMWDIAHHFTDNDKFEEQISLLNLLDMYIVSQPKEKKHPLCLDFQEKKFFYKKTYEKFLVRPVFDF